MIDDCWIKKKKRKKEMIMQEIGQRHQLLVRQIKIKKMSLPDWVSDEWIDEWK